MSASTSAPGSHAASRLAIAYSFTPYAGTSAIVAAKRIRVRGEPVDLIQNRMDEIRGTDPSSDQIAAPLIRRRAVLPTLSRFGAWFSIQEFCDEGWATIEEWQREDGAYSSVYSRAHFIASHFLAARYKIRHPIVPWEADFSDPLSRNAVGELRDSQVREGELLDELRAGISAAGGTPPGSDNVYVWGEYATLTLADKLVFTNAAQRDYVLNLYSPDDPVIARARQRATVSAHPTLPAEFYEMAAPQYDLAPGKVHVGYFGNFYSSQHPDFLLGAAYDLPAADRARVRLHFFTGSKDELQQRVEELGIGGFVHVNDRIPYLTFLSLAKRMDVLLAVDAATPPGQDHNPVLLSKWSDYAGSGTPVWGVVEEGSAMDSQDLALRSPIKHRTAALQVLTNLSRAHPE